ncbi:11826_t:CDS:1 [Dentiscutata erythropus]|uniref:11826_t:CDS:1 n=1 Tax=Dentiscutata erythropus TaxID=1348616 RepID=A0A9N9HP05_9GLOM|nr:11826_t:CDS:1 [Dentiscutata erythropus]
MVEIFFENPNEERIGPGKEKYLYYSSKAYFTYGLNRNKFQNGYLGLNPSEVSGIFHIRYPESKPLKATKIELYFCGIVNTQWADYNGYCSNSKEICKEMKCIWKANSNEENITSLDYPFKFTIPNESPSSINYIGEYKVNGTIYYTINAIIYRKTRRIFESSEKVIEVRADIKRWQLLTCPDYNPDLLIEKNELYKCQVLLDKSTFDIKGIINIPINFQIYKQNVIVKKIKVKLVEYFKLKNFAASNKGSLVKQTVNGNEVLSIPNSENEFSVVVKLDLSKVKKLWNNEAVINCSCITELFEIFHKVKINILMGKANSVKFKKEIKLCNIVSDDALEEYMEDNIF